MQVLQAANTGITSLQKLVDTAKSVANQALQTRSATPPSRRTPRDHGATTDIRVANQDPISARSTARQLRSGRDTSTASAAGRPAQTAGPVNATASTLCRTPSPLPVAAADTLTVNGKTITLSRPDGPLASGNAYTLVTDGRQLHRFGTGAQSTHRW